MPRIGSWTIRLMAPEVAPENFTKEWDDKNQQVVDDFAGNLSGIETALSEQVPEGFYVKIEDH